MKHQGAAFTRTRSRGVGSFRNGPSLWSGSSIKIVID